MKFEFQPSVTALAVAAAITLALASSPATAISMIGLTNANQLLRFDSAAPLGGTAVSITGLEAGERMVSIDYRNPDNTVYGLGTLGYLYTLNTATGAATRAGVLPITGAGYEIDWNPNNNNLRIIGNGAGSSSNNSAYTFGGATATQTPLSSPGVGTLDVVGAAYNNNFANSPAATLNLYYIDAATDVLYVNNNAFASGVLTKVANLTYDGRPFDVRGLTGFDIAFTGDAFLSAFYLSGYYLFKLDLSNGKLTAASGFFEPVVSVTAVVPEPQTQTIVLAGLVVIGGLVSRRARN